MSTAREAILAALAHADVPPAPLPSAPSAPSVPSVRSAPSVQIEMPLMAPAEAGEAVRRFTEALELAGGAVVESTGLAAFSFTPPGDGARRDVVSCVSGLAISTLTIAADAPRERLDRIGLAVLPARFGVAENGAVWVDERDLPHRALPFIAEHLVVVLDRREIVADLHEAYRRLRPPLPGYGVFIAGPSKTADIEQALVIGAQGPKSLLVLLV